jgi:hypothetical protein
MFGRGISKEFVDELKNWTHWKDIISDRDLFVAIRNDYINIYYQGCSIFKISHKGGQLIFETHFKYLVRPNMKNPLVSWDGESPARTGRLSEILIPEFDLNSFKKSSSSYAEPEKKGVHSILKSNKNVVDVEIALSHKSEDETDSEGQNSKGRRAADRIDFAAIQGKDGKARIVFFEAKRFDNGELKSRKGEPPVFEQIRNYETFIKQHRQDLEKSYRKACKNLVDLAPPNRYDPLVKEVADSPEQLIVDPDVRLVVFGYDKDEDKGTVWNKHKKILRDHFQSRLLLKGSPSEFTNGISKYSLEGPARL